MQGSTNESDGTVTDAAANVQAGRRGDERVAVVLSGGGMGGAGFHLATLERLVHAGELRWETVTEMVGVSIGACVSVALLTLNPDDPRCKLVASGILGTNRTTPGYGGILGSLRTRMKSGWRGALLPGVGDAQRIVDALNEAHEVQDPAWPEDVDLKIVAWDVADWRRKVFTAESNVHPSRAAGASSALPPFFAPFSVAGRGYVDGAVGSNTHADIVGDVDRVIILSALSGKPAGSGGGLFGYISRRHIGTLEKEIEALEARGIQVTVYEPSDDVSALIWRNPLAQRTGRAVYDEIAGRHVADEANRPRHDRPST